MSPRDIQKLQANTTSAAVNMDVLLRTVYIDKPTPGEKIINQVNILKAPDAGYLFNTMYQKKDTANAEYLKDAGIDGPPSKYFGPAANFYFDVCGASVIKGRAGPPVDITINILRTTGLTNATQNVNEIEFFLNHMPSIFPSQMSPYFNVEFQFVDLGSREAALKEIYINRPSLERFLMGSSIAVLNDKATLTAVDLALMSAIKTGDKKSDFMGMEMFTTPQTLTNMDQLDEKQGVRLNSVKPFLPPATILSAQFNTRNSGAGKFLHQTVDLELKIHDKARIPEFSEFFSGASGTHNVIIWLTYGWLAPRSRGDQDYYAKFINENMLVREAFEVQNSSFSFDTVGQATVKIQLVSKGINLIDTAKLQAAASTEKVAREAMISYIKNHREVLGARPQSPGIDIKIYQVLDSAIAGSAKSGMSVTEHASAISAAKSYAEKIGDPAKKLIAENVVTYLDVLYASTDGATKTNMELTIIHEIKNSFNVKFNQCGKQPKDSPGSADPFYPTGKMFDADKPFFAPALVKSLEDKSLPKGKPTKQAEKAAQAARDAAREGKDEGIGEDMGKGKCSFGKLFCVFCMESLAKAAAAESIDEVQVNFYQLNESCGPVSLHSIAEFPIDIDSFKVQYATYCMNRGGEMINIQEFLKFVLENQFADHRSPGYGMRRFYEPFTLSNDGHESKRGEDKEYQDDMSKWLSIYGEFKLPAISFKIETVLEDSTGSNIDLLHHLQSEVGSAGAYKAQPSTGGTNQDGTTKKKIKKISIYDKQLSPYSEKMELIRNDSNASFSLYKKPPPDPALARAAAEADAAVQTLKGTKNPNANVLSAAVDNADKAQAAVATADANANKSATVGRTIDAGKNVLKNYISETIPTLTIGGNGSLITSITLASKVDGLIGMNNLQGGSQQLGSTLSPNGLSMAKNSLPIRMSPAQLTMTSLGCPLANLYQQYFIDFGTGTTIDNLYTVSQISHTISPGKFETSWTFIYYDGYGKFFGAPTLAEFKGENKDNPPPDDTADLAAIAGRVPPKTPIAKPGKKGK